MAQASHPLTLMERFALAAYDFVLRALQPLLRRKLNRRAQKEPEYALNVAQRFGQYVGDRPAGGFVWLHAVSLGETRAAALLLPALRAALPGMRLLLTHSTATGLAQGRSLLQPGDVQVWLPWDTVQATGRFLMRFKPRIGLLMETEVWPRLVEACRRADVPLCLLNARMSEKSLRQAMRLAVLSGPAYRGLTLVLAQSEADAQRLQKLGCQDVRVVGNLKFDVDVSDQAQTLAKRWRDVLSARPVVMLASTREGEESLWLEALQSNPERLARLKALHVLWLVVPRHPQRFDEVHALIEQAGLRCVRRSAWADGEPDTETMASADAVLGDSLGEMQAYYLVSRMALLGGSFAPLGGQNLIEAAACECPVVMGPHTFNFSEAAALAKQEGAALQVQDMQAALDLVVSALTQPEWLEQMQTATVQMLEKGRGAVADHIKALSSVAVINMNGGL
jgi:3-deoxy-D-manno-octulosonic-acid transferase